MVFEVVRTEEEINRVLNWAAEAVAEGRSHFQGESYESGVEAAIRWLSDKSSDPPDR